LAGRTFAAKDLFDVAGHVTGGGNPDWLATHDPAEKTAWAVQTLVDAGATMVGKTHTDELSRGIFGENAHYGTPINPRAPGRVPGGSSSGSAAAVAGDLVDFAIGTDTGGSVRVPASFCGLYGMRPTHGRIPFDGALPQAPTFDTVGALARDAQTFAAVASVLLGATPLAGSRRRLAVAVDLFEAADAGIADALQPAVKRISEHFSQATSISLVPEGLSTWVAHQTALQSREAWTTFSDWIDRVNPRFGYEVAGNFLRNLADDNTLAKAAAFRAEMKKRFDEFFADGTVVCLPTTPFVAPLRGQRRSSILEARRRVLEFTCIAGMLGAPQVSIPLVSLGEIPLGISLLGAPRSDAALVDLATTL